MPTEVESCETSKTMELYDLVVIGAGVFGLPVAKTYLQVNPSARLLILDACQTVGGTWSKERLYDGLVTNNLVGLFEYSDFPMDFETYGVPPGEHIPGMVVHKYLTSYAKHYGFFDKIRFQSTVTLAEMKIDGSWIISYETKKGHDTVNMKLAAKKMVLATGATSIPNIPQIPGSPDFGGPIFHFKDYQRRKDDMKQAKNILVLGGAKSAVDAAYLNASEGRHVDWIIRASGRGPAWLSTAHVTPANLAFEKLATTRVMSWLSPSLYTDSFSSARRLLHNTRIGRAFLRVLFKVINHDIASRAKYNDHPDTKKLRPDSSVEWYGSFVSIFNQPTDLFSLIRNGMITIHRADVTSLSRNTVHLSSGEDIKGDLLICATGWKAMPSFPITPSKISQKIGISTTPPTDSVVRAAEAEILLRFPILKDRPEQEGLTAAKNCKPGYFHLYRGTVPPAFLSSRNFAYSGAIYGLRAFLIAQIQALWMTAFFNHQLSVPLPSESEAEWDSLLQSCYWRRRAPNGLGPTSADMIFEIMPFLDTLMRDLGLESNRKLGWFKELFEHYGVRDYDGVVEEWLAKEAKLRELEAPLAR